MKVKYYDLENKRVFVTGGGSGIGASIVEHFCEQGSEVYFIDLNVEASNELIELIKSKNLKAETAALSTAKYLWNFLSGMTAKHKLQLAA